MEQGIFSSQLSEKLQYMPRDLKLTHQVSILNIKVYIYTFKVSLSVCFRGSPQLKY